MGRRKDKKPGRGRLLDAWVPPDDAGEPIGVVATSFTFDPVFFEEECLGRFLSLETDPQEDGPLYLIEREEKLSGVSCASVLVDQHHCRGERSLRWDLLPARVPGAILHAKVSLLHWANLVRVVVASANLTEDAYRRNQEIFGAIDYFDGSDAALPCLDGMIAFLRGTAALAEMSSATKSAAVERWNGFLNRLQTATRSWGSRDPAPTRRKTRIHAVTSQPEAASVLQQVRDLWPAGSVPDVAVVTSPFFDLPEAENKPAKEIWNVLKRRGEAKVYYNVRCEETSADGALFVFAPESLKKAGPRGRADTGVFFDRVSEREGEDDAVSHRPLHHKSIWLEDEDWGGYLIGSSNFTSAGLGLANRPNWEANLLYLANRIANIAGHRALLEARVVGTPIDDDKKLNWQSTRDAGDDASENAPNLPWGFQSAVYRVDECKKAIVHLVLGEELPEAWTVRRDSRSSAFYDEARWLSDGKPRQVELPWPEDQPPSGFEVVWPGIPAPAWWPVNIESSASLPPPAELKDLPLELLIHVLTSARPLHAIMRDWRRRHPIREGDDEGPIIDPHKRVDTSAYLLQRTRRVSWAFSALRGRLERPVATREALQWRLRGPVGVRALADAIIREARPKAQVERPFLIAELMLELSRVRPRTGPGCLAVGTVKEAIRKVSEELRAELDSSALDEVPALRSYIERVAQEASK